MKGMIHSDGLSDFAARVVQTIGKLQTLLRTFVPAEWPVFEGGFFSGEDYFRTHFTGIVEVSGFSNRWIAEGLAGWADGVGTVASGWQAAREALQEDPIKLQLLDTFFSKFDSGGDHDFPGGKFPRPEWRAGSYNKEGLAALLAEINRQIAALVPLLDPWLLSDQLEDDSDLLTAKEWQWQPDSPPGHGPVVTLEIQPGTLGDIIESSWPLLWPNTSPSDPAMLIWDASKAEVHHKREQAIRIIDALSTYLDADGAEWSLDHAIRESVRIWRRGKQAKFRGP